MIPDWLIRPLLYALAIAAIAGTGFYYGAAHVQREWQEQLAAQAKAAVAVVVKQGEVTTRVVTRWRDREAAQAPVDETIKKEASEYAVSETRFGAAACGLDNRWVRLHNAAAAGEVPPAAAGSDGEPSGITTAQALEPVTDNYAACRAVARRLSALQAWVRGEYEATNGEALGY